MADDKGKKGGAAANKKIEIASDFFEVVAQYRECRETLKALEAQDIFIKSIIHTIPGERPAQEISKDETTGKYVISLDISEELAEQINPQSPHFNAELYEQHTAKLKKQLQDTIEDLRQSVMNVTLQEDTVKELSNLLSTAVETMQATARKVTDALATLIQDNQKEQFKRLAEFFQTVVEHRDEIEKAAAEWQQLEPFLRAELSKPEYNGVTLDELLQSEDEESQSMFDRAIEAATAARIASIPTLTVTGKGANTVEFPLDKINANIWNLFRDADKNGQITLFAKTAKKGTSKQASVLYSINFSALENAGLNTVKRLTAFDKRVYIAANALYNDNENGYMTVSEIYATMGNNSRINKRDIDKIYTSLEKMRILPITVDNWNIDEAEAKAYKNIPRFVYNGVLLPWESIDAIVNGQRAEGIIHLLREPPLVSFAKERKQITTVERELLASPISKTDIHLAIEDYLLERISHIKNSNGKMSNKLLYATIFEKANITSRDQKSRGKETIKRYLDHYKAKGFIKNYKETADGVTITYQSQ